MDTKCVLLDWGDTLMVNFPGQFGPMALWPEVEAVLHAAETLRWLRNSGLFIALATNAADSSEAEIRAALRRVDLDDLIDRVYCSREVGHSKPSAAFFSFIEQDLGLSASELVMVGDNFDIDVLGANEAGIRAVWLREGGGVEQATAMWRSIRGLRELPEVLRSWTRAT